MIRLTESDVRRLLPQENLHDYLRQLLRDAWKGYRRSFRKCRAKFSEGSVHELRVQTRRLLALLNLLGTLAGRERVGPTGELLRRVMRWLAGLRDTQVQLLRVEKSLRAFPDIKAFHNSLRERERRLIDRIGTRMRRARLGRFKSTMTILRRTVRRVLADQPHEHQHAMSLFRSMNQAYIKVAVLRGRCHAGNPQTLHRLRIAFKEFRYMVELLHPLLPGVTQHKLSVLHDFQTCLGEIQDTEVLASDLDDVMRKQPKKFAALEGYRREIERQRTALVQSFLEKADRVYEFQAFCPSLPNTRHVDQSASEPSRLITSVQKEEFAT